MPRVVVQRGAGVLTAPVVFDGAVNDAIFMVYVQSRLGPTLRPGESVVMDSFSAHKVKGVRKAMRADGGRVPYLPPYGPDLNPIEIAFSRLKAMLRENGERTVDALWKRIGSQIDKFASIECTNDFRSSYPEHKP